jgi:hypothetical protein
VVLHVLPGHLLPEANAMRALQSWRHLPGLLPWCVVAVNTATITGIAEGWTAASSARSYGA